MESRSTPSASFDPEWCIERRWIVLIHVNAQTRVRQLAVDLSLHNILEIPKLGCYAAAWRLAVYVRVHCLRLRCRLRCRSAFVRVLCLLAPAPNASLTLAIYVRPAVCVRALCLPAFVPLVLPIAAPRCETALLVCRLEDLLKTEMGCVARGS